MTKRLSIIIGLALVIAMASVTLAYAAANSGYADWSATAGGNGGFSATPHKNYTTTTVKCAVCHAVHKGRPAGELLLMGTAGGSCEFCHIADNIGLVRLYNGNATNYTNPSAQAHNDFAAGAAVGSRCTDCHAIHGANTLNDASVDKYILKSTTSASGGPGGVASQQAKAASKAVAGDKQSQVDAFCSMCHPYYQDVYNGTITVGAYHAGGPAQNGIFQSHVMTAATATYGNPRRSIAATRVAWVGSEHCRNCHDAGVTDAQGTLPASTIVAESYPHYTPSYTRFMVSKGFSTEATAGLSYTPSNDGSSNTLPDGACLKCHRGTAANTGVGFNF